MSGCPNYNRHWFTARRMPTVRLPRCVRCYAANPSWTPEVAAAMEDMGYGAAWRRHHYDDRMEHRTASPSGSQPEEA